MTVQILREDIHVQKMVAYVQVRIPCNTYTSNVMYPLTAWHRNDIRKLDFRKGISPVFVEEEIEYYSYI